ncbi:NADH-ubiquinone oxidoreductase chain 1-like [Telopea speciosissima]|uniref:NADH-ubiquinone oxidoreductase chain 1-like n=1 Tax=Telopea speciosissima TaxID=54955 RepID=UPI001CC5069B|nr:NADH-ubiquinone oxidoreductase chain 1-like [Telopea speciosissima]
MKLLFSLLEVLIVILPILLAVAYVTVAERKAMGSMQRRLGPNKVGYLGTLQAFADALKLIVKETIIPAHANSVLFFLGPIITLIFALLGWGVIPFGPGLAISDYNLGLLYSIAISSLGVYGLLIAGWAANSKYAFVGSLRSAAQLVSYELVLSSAMLIVLFITGSLNITTIIEYQQAVWFIVPLFPVFIIFFIGALAETNRAPFDLPEAESELVAGFMTEHSAVIFVFFFLAEYSNIILISTLTAILFLGGYLLPSIPQQIYLLSSTTQVSLTNIIGITSMPLVNGAINGLVLGLKATAVVFLFIWVRASFPRIRYDQLLQVCWMVLLPLVFAIIILVPCIIYSFDLLPFNTL